MSYAKINAEKVIAFPYSYQDLVKENPFSNYSTKYNISEWYSKTKEAKENGYKVVIVNYLEEPVYDKENQIAIQKTYPELIDGNVFIGWEIVDIQKTTTSSGPSAYDLMAI